jgi:hypothetical protein
VLFMTALCQSYLLKDRRNVDSAGDSHYAVVYVAPAMGTLSRFYWECISRQLTFSSLLFRCLSSAIDYCSFLFYGYDRKQLICSC